MCICLFYVYLKTSVNHIAYFDSSYLYYANTKRETLYYKQIYMLFNLIVSPVDAARNVSS